MKHLTTVAFLFLVIHGYGQLKDTSVMDSKAINEILISQYKAGFQMLRQAINKTPEDQWNSTEYNNPGWQIAYHVIWSAKFYLGADPESFIPWEKAIEGAESFGGTQEWENPEEGIVVEGFNSKEELLSFISEIESSLPKAIEVLPLNEPSGFEWYPYTRLELHLNNIRHIQHHTAQLIEGLKAKGITGFPWAIGGN